LYVSIFKMHRAIHRGTRRGTQNTELGSWNNTTNRHFALRQFPWRRIRRQSIPGPQTRSVNSCYICLASTSTDGKCHRYAVRGRKSETYNWLIAECADQSSHKTALRHQIGHDHRMKDLPKIGTRLFVSVPCNISCCHQFWNTKPGKAHSL